MEQLHDVARALSALNNKGIFHRDLGESEIFLDGRNVKFSDWGSAETPRINMGKFWIEIELLKKFNGQGPHASWLKENKFRDLVHFIIIAHNYAETLQWSAPNADDSIRKYFPGQPGSLRVCSVDSRATDAQRGDRIPSGHPASVHLSGARRRDSDHSGRQRTKEAHWNAEQGQPVWRGQFSNGRIAFIEC
jgi:serine/threonine protein kinase